MSFWAQLIASNLVMACLIGSLAWLVGRNGRQATLAHTLWLLLFVKLITPPLVTVPLPFPETWWPTELAVVESNNEAVTAGETATVAHSGEETSSAHPNRSAHTDLPAATPATSWNWTMPIHWSYVLVGVWLMGFLWIAVRGCVKLIRFYRLLKRHGTVDEAATGFVRGLLVRANGSTSQPRYPQVLRVPMRVSPMLFGWGTRAYIVCPDSLWDAFEEEERNAFLAHETAHYHRRDHWVRWLEWSVTALYWWFPLVYFARRQLERHEEACCDAWAVRMLEASPRQYAEALLQVVDFISEYEVGMVRLASGMQPTYTLEERLHLIMKGGQPIEQARRFRTWFGMACLMLCVLHPIVKLYRPLPLPTNLVASSDSDFNLNQLKSDSTRPANNHTAEPLDLPPEPEGFWNSRPKTRWADVSLSLPGARLVADADEGVRFMTADGKTLQFKTEELTSVAEIAATKRVVIGNQEGQLRLWDLAAAMPVSLIGLHPAPVTSVAYHERAGLFSADEAGSVMRWDVQSGQVLATWAETSSSVQSVRLSNDGQSLAILCGAWEDLGQPQQLFVVDSQTLRPKFDVSPPIGTAVVVPSTTGGWYSVRWTGHITDLTTGVLLGQIPKHYVSSLVLCQDSPLQKSP